MRKHLLLIAVAAVFAFTSVAPLYAVTQSHQQEQEQMAKDVAGNLQTVNLDESTIVVKQEDESEITLVVNDETVVRSSDGEPTTLAALDGMEGQTVTARFVEIGESNVALSIQLVAS